MVRRRLEHAIEPAVRSSFRSDDLCATAACEPRPYRILFVSSGEPLSASGRVVPGRGEAGGGAWLAWCWVRE